MKKHTILIQALTSLAMTFAIDNARGQLNLGSNNTIGPVPYSSITGGDNHVNNGINSIIGGGEQNTISLYADYSFIGGGALNVVAGPISGISSGEGNSIGINGSWSFISGGSHNELFSMFSIIGGGGANILNLGTDYSTIGGGYANTATSSDYVTIGGGVANIVKNNADYSAIGGGFWNTNTAANTTIAGGAQNSANGAYSSVPGGKGAVARLYGQTAQASGFFSQPGDAQASTYILRGITTDNTSRELFLDGSGARLTIPVGASWVCNIQIVCRSTSKSGGSFLSDFYETAAILENENGTVRGGEALNHISLMDNNAFPPEFSSGFVTQLTKAAHGGYSVTISADDNNDSLKIVVNGNSGHTVRWVAVVRTAEVIMP